MSRSPRVPPPRFHRGLNSAGRGFLAASILPHGLELVRGEQALEVVAAVEELKRVALLHAPAAIDPWEGCTDQQVECMEHAVDHQRLLVRSGVPCNLVFKSMPHVGSIHCHQVAHSHQTVHRQRAISLVVRLKPSRSHVKAHL